MGAATLRRALATAAAVLAVALFALDVALVGGYDPLLLVQLATLPLALVGALLVVRLPGNAVGWFLVASGLVFALSGTGGTYAYRAYVSDPGSLPGAAYALVLGDRTFPAAIGSILLMLFHFPTGTTLGRRWRLAEAAVALVVVGGTLGGMLDATPLTPPLPEPFAGGGGATVPNPLALPGELAGLAALAHSLTSAPTLPLALLGPLSLFVRYRRSSTVVRQQLKLVAYAGLVAVVLLIGSNVLPDPAGTLLWIACTVALGLVPVAIAVAIFRYRLYDIDVLINRTIVYGALSASLVLTYVLAVLAFQLVLRPFTASSDLAVAGSTLAVVAVFQPLRSRIQRVVDHRFYRSKYDAERTIDAFRTRLRDETDLDTLERDLIAIVNETVRPDRATVWLRGDAR